MTGEVCWRGVGSPTWQNDESPADPSINDIRGWEGKDVGPIGLRLAIVFAWNLRRDNSPSTCRWYAEVVHGGVGADLVLPIDAASPSNVSVGWVVVVPCADGLSLSATSLKGRAIPWIETSDQAKIFELSFCTRKWTCGDRFWCCWWWWKSRWFEWW